MKKQIKKLKEKGYASEIYFYEIEQIPVQFKSNKLYSISTKRKNGYGVRILKDGRMGYSSVYGEGYLDKAVEAALEAWKIGVEAEYSLPGESHYRRDLKIFDENVKRLKTDQIIKIGEGIVDSLSRIGEVQTDVNLTKVVKKVRIINSEGFEAEYRTTDWSMYTSIFTIISGSITWIGDIFSSSKYVDRSKASIRYIKDLYKNAGKIAKTINGKKDVIFAPTALYTLLLPIYRGVNGDNVVRGISPLIGKLGKKILSDKISIVDNPHMAWGYLSIPVDDEGVPTMKKYIVREGVLENYLLDLRSAARLKLKSTGNGLRSGVSLPAPGATNIEIKPGDMRFEDMIRNMKDGLVVYSVLGAGQSNILAGDFSVNASLAFRVKNGEIVGRVKDTMISGNAYDLLKKVKEISKERKNFMGMLLPAIKFRGVNIAGK